jgi:hypothetical protein
MPYCNILAHVRPLRTPLPQVFFFLAIIIATIMIIKITANPKPPIIAYNAVFEDDDGVAAAGVGAAAGAGGGGGGGYGQVHDVPKAFHIPLYGSH